MDNYQLIIQYILKYGTTVIFLLLFLEQLNFPGLASSILMPAVGVLVAKFYIYVYTNISGFIIRKHNIILFGIFYRKSYD